MSQHPSDLRLDAELAGQPLSPEEAAHLAGCPACQARRQALRQTYERARADPRFATTLAGLPRPGPAPEPAWRRWAPWLALPVAAALVLLLARPRAPAPDGQLKGAPSLAVLAVPPAHGPAFRPGDQVELRLGPAGHGYAVVLALEPGCAVSRLFPPDGPAPLPVGADVPLGRFEVTPGDARVLALLFDAPADPEALAARARQACGALPTQPGEVGRVETSLAVESGP